MLPHSPLYPQRLKLALHMKDATLVEEGENISNEQLMSEYPEGDETSFLLCPQIVLLSSFLNS